MKRMTLLKCNTLVFLIAGTLAATPVLADREGGQGGRGKHDQRDQARGERGNDHQRDQRDEGRGERGYDQRDWNDEGGHVRFDDRRRMAIHEYYDDQFRRGRCPPGLAKRHNGCMPPGQARRWQIGHRLPPDVIYYDLPPTVVTRIGPPPQGHRYVRVASDILLIAIGTGMIVDAIDDLNQ